MPFVWVAMVLTGCTPPTPQDTGDPVPFSGVGEAGEYDVVLSAAGAEPTSRDPEGGTYVIPGEVIVRLVQPDDANTLERLTQAYSLTLIGQIPQIGVFQLRATDPSGTAVDTGALALEAGVMWADEHILLQSGAVASCDESDDFCRPGNFWAYDRTQVAPVWDAGFLSDSNTIIAIVDIGINTQHPDLAGKVSYSWSPYGPIGGIPLGSTYHGTQVAGIAGAAKDNGLGIVGLAPDAMIAAYELGHPLSFELTDPLAMAACLTHLWLKYGGVSSVRIVVNISQAFPSRQVWGGDIGRELVSRIVGPAIDLCSARGFLIVAGTGQSSGNAWNIDETPVFPASWPNVLAVTGTFFNEVSGELTPYNWGRDVLCAPQGLRAPVGADGFAGFSGTSCSAPFVSGVAALVWSAAPELTAYELSDILRESADVLEYPSGGTHTFDDGTPARRVNARRALEMAGVSIDSDDNQEGPGPGGQWTPLGNGLDGWSVFAMTVHNDDLIVAGPFTVAGQSRADHIACWDGTQWAPLGTGTDLNVFALSTYNRDLIAGGFFTTAGGGGANCVARWDGQEWWPLGDGMDRERAEPVVFDLTVYDGDLIAAGSFDTAGGAPARNIARWDGISWMPLEAGVNELVSSLTLYDGELIAGGFFTTADGAMVNYIARWDGTRWAPLGEGTNGAVNALATYRGELIVGGDFTIAGGREVHGIARWDGDEWRPLGSGVGLIEPGDSPDVWALTRIIHG